MRLVILFVVAVFFIPAAWAFNFQTHSAICQIAYEQLTPKAQQRIDALIKKTPYDSFAKACPWPDSIRKEKIHKASKYWHYMNLPRSAKTVTEKDCGKNGCVLSAIPLMQKRLAKNPDNDWQSLLFLSHFVADLHQPLHISYADDLGGNKLHLQQKNKAITMHQLWDNGLLSHRKYEKQAEIWLKEMTAAKKAQWQQGTPLVWAQESFAITQDAYRLIPPSHKVDEKYKEYFAPILAVQAQKASVRLAMMLNSIYN